MPIKGFEKDWMAEIGATERLEEEIAAEKLSAEESHLAIANFNASEVKAIAEQDVNMLAGLAMPLVFEYLFPKVLLAAWYLLTTEAKKFGVFRQIALGIPRGHGKTTLVKLFILWCILFTKRRFILVIGSNADMAENVISDVCDMLEEPNIKALFGDWKAGRETNRQDLKKFAFRERIIILAAIGQGGAIRGLNLKHERPDVMIFEDVQTKECSESLVQSAALERWMLGTAMKAKSPHGCLFIYNGNMYPGQNCILRKLKTNPTWIKFISGAILADGTALWPEHRDLKSLIEEFDNDIAAGHPEIFLSEVMNDTETGINTRTDLSQIKQWPWQPEDNPQGKFIIIDPATDKTRSDDVAIGYFEVYDGIPALRKVYEEKLSPGNTIRRALLLAIQTKTRVIAVESNAYQYSLLYWFGVICEQLALTGFDFVEVYSGGYAKNSRISDTLKELTAGEIILHDEVRSKVLQQIANWNPLRRNNIDNILDLLSYSKKVMELYAPMIATDSGLIESDSEMPAGVIENHVF